MQQKKPIVVVMVMGAKELVKVAVMVGAELVVKMVVVVIALWIVRDILLSELALIARGRAVDVIMDANIPARELAKI